MILRGAIVFGLTWLLLPHHPDLGLGTHTEMAGEKLRSVILSRRREVRSEFGTQAGIRENKLLVWDAGWGVALQKAGRLPDQDQHAAFRQPASSSSAMQRTP